MKDITVYDIPYNWFTNDNCDGEGGKILNILFDKRIIFEKFYDKYTQITPKMITNIIISLND